MTAQTDTQTAYLIDAMTRQYLETALWSEYDEDESNNPRPFDDRFTIENFPASVKAKARQTCAGFYAAHKAQIDEYSADEEENAGRAGHYLWLTRNRHGSGFWDGNYEPQTGADLTDAAHALGEVNLQRNRRWIYFFPESAK
jgi:hypothetical protein